MKPTLSKDGVLRATMNVSFRYGIDTLTEAATIYIIETFDLKVQSQSLSHAVLQLTRKRCFELQRERFAALGNHERYEFWENIAWEDYDYDEDEIKDAVRTRIEELFPEFKS